MAITHCHMGMLYMPNSDLIIRKMDPGGCTSQWSQNHEPPLYCGPKSMDHPCGPRSMDHPCGPTSMDHPCAPRSIDHPCRPTSMDHLCGPSSMDHPSGPKSMDQPLWTPGLLTILQTSLPGPWSQSSGEVHAPGSIFCFFLSM